MKLNGKKLLALVLAMLMTFALCATAMAYTKGDVLECTGSDVNVRKGPGTSYSKLGTLDKGEKVTFISKSGSWSKVEYEGETAYVYSKYLKASNESSTSNSSVMYATTGVRVRSGPGTSYTQVGTLVEDQAVTRIGKSGSWIKINYNGTAAYVHGKYLTTVVPDGVDDSTNGSNNGGMTPGSNTVVTKHATYVYRGPGQSYGILYTVQANTTFTATGLVSGAFTQVNTPYGIGYVQTSTISGNVDTTASAGTIVSATYLYKEPAYNSSNYGIVLNVGTQVTCTGVVSGVWTQVSYGGYTGYVHKDCVRTGSINTGTDGQGQYVRYVIAAPATVYDRVPVVTNNSNNGGFGGGSGSSTVITGANILGTLGYGTQVTCLGVSGSYTKIVYGNGYGYVATNALSTTLGTSGGGSVTTPTTGTATVNTNTYVYSSASSSSSILGVLFSGNTVTTTGASSNGYTQVIYNGTYAFIPTSCLTITSSGSGSGNYQGYRTVKAGAVIYNATTYAAEYVKADTLVLLISIDSATGNALIQDAAGTKYIVSSSYLSGSNTSGGSYLGYRTIKAGATVYNTATSAYEYVASDTSVLLISIDSTSGNARIQDAAGVQYIVASAYLK